MLLWSLICIVAHVLREAHRPLARCDAAGFIGTYLVKELLAHGHEVVGLDNYSKYGPIRQDCDDHPRYKLVVGDAKDIGLLSLIAIIAANNEPRPVRCIILLRPRPPHVPSAKPLPYLLLSVYQSL